MDAEKIKVLLIGETENTNSTLTERLVRGGCECCFAASNREVDALLDNNGFDLMLGPIRLRDDSLYPLIGLLDGSRTTLFYSQTVEDGCWWLPGLWRGLNCFGAPALRPGEFAAALEATIEDIRSRADVTVEAAPPITPHHSDSAVKLPYFGGLPHTGLLLGSESLSRSARYNLR